MILRNPTYKNISGVVPGEAIVPLFGSNCAYRGDPGYVVRNALLPGAIRELHGQRHIRLREGD